MSVDLQGPRGHEQFAVNTKQFEEIIPSRDEQSSRSQLTPEKEKMDKDKDVDGHSDKEREKERKKSPLQSNYSSDDYEEDFEDSEPGSPKKPPQTNKADSRRNSSPRRSAMSNSSRSPERSSAKSPSISSPRSDKKSNIGKTKRIIKAYDSPRSSSLATARHTEKSWSRPKNKSASVKGSRLDQSVVDRVLSANRHRVQKLESRLSQLIKELTQEREENKTLRDIHYRQEKELKKVDNGEAELPRLITKHSTEVKSLKERLRRLQETANQKENRINEQDKEILKLRDRCKHYKDLCEMKNLTERAELQKKLTKTEENLEKRDSEISKLQRMVNLKDKTHARHLKEQNDKLREAQARVKEMEENYNNLLNRLKEKQKQLDYTNIYQRQIVLKEEENDNALPEAPPKLAALPAPKKTKPKPKPKKTVNNNKNNGQNTKDKTVNEKKKVEVNKKPDSFFLTAHSDTGSDKELDKGGEMTDKDHGKMSSIVDGNDISDMALSTLDKDTSFEDQLAKENERRKREEFEKSLREEEERLKKEKEESERRRRDEEERDEKERMEREAKWQQETERKAKEEAERREASARRAREEEERKKAEAKERETLPKEDSFFEDEETRRKKEQLLARLQAIDNENLGNDSPYQSDGKRVSSGKSGDESVKSSGSKNNGYASRHADENLHNGLPALANENKTISPPVSVKSDPDGIAGIPRHKPVLIGRGNLTKKSNPFSWLDDNKKPNSNSKVKRNDDFSFGDYSPSMSDSKKKSGDMNNDDIFDTGLSRRPARGRRGLGDNGLDFGERRGSFDKPKTHSNLPFLADDFGSKKNTESPSNFPSLNEPLLPRRRRAQEKSGPAISSAFDDNLDDDIEELAL